MKEKPRSCSSGVLCGGSKQCAPRFPENSLSPRYSLNESSEQQCQDDAIFNRWLCKTDKMFEPLRKTLFLDPSSFVSSCYGTWWSTSHEFSLHVVPRKHQKRRKVHAGSIHAGNNYHEWTPLSWRQRMDPSLSLQGDNFAYFMLNDSETRFVIAESAMRREGNQPQHWLKYVEKFWIFLSLVSYSCCRSSLGLAQPQSRMVAHKVTQPLPARYSLFYWMWTDKTVFMASSNSFNTSFC